MSMTKVVSTLALCLSFFLTAHAQQDLAGFRTGNYTGVNGVFFNPASIANNHYRWDVNIAGVSANVSNNQAKFRLNDLGDSFSGDKLGEQFFGKNAGYTNGLVNVAIHLPSFMFSVGPKMAFAVTARTRVLGNIKDIDGQLVDQITSDAASFSDLPYTISSGSNTRINISGWSEIGASFAREVYAKGPHYFKAGATLKYLMGTGNANVYLDQFNATVNADLVLQDAYINNANANLGLNFSGADITHFDTDQLTKFSGHGIGVDLGGVYEWRPESGKQYKLKVGIALLDLGKINFKRDAQRSADYEMSVSNAQRFYLSELNGVALNDYRAKLNEFPQYFKAGDTTSTAKYSVSLPATLQMDVDYHVYNKFYINAASQIGLNSEKVRSYNGHFYSVFAVTPRYEGRRYGFFLPLSYNSLTKLNAGFSLHAGPVYLGSGSVLSALVGDSRQADVFIGFRVSNLSRSKK